MRRTRFARPAALALACGVVSALLPAVSSAASAAVPASAAAAAATPGNDVVGAVPAAFTPWINNGQTHAITQVGGTMVVGGTFTSVSPSGGSTTLTRNHIMAFDAKTGAISSFAPSVNGAVESVQPGPTAGTVFVGGAFTSIDGVAAPHLALLNLATGARVSGFTPPAIDGAINAMRVAGGRLYLGGYFLHVKNQARGGLATLNATTGALDPFLTVALAGHHSTGSHQDSVGVRGMDLSSDGSRLVVIGNFTTADGLPRDQLVMINTAGTTAAVQQDWNTTRYQPQCFNWAFDADVREVRFAPDGSWFVVNATGGQNGGSLCDATVRWETSATGSDIQPTWVDYTGGDTVWGLAITDKVVYAGGHQRWMNNSQGSDFAGPGAVPRPGLVALDAGNGMPLGWNPGRNPRGAGAYSLFMGTDGLYVGSDTPWIGNQKYKRPRIAFFPLASGAPLASDATRALPADVYLAGQRTSGSSNVLYRVDAGGPSLQSLDSGPDWAADTSDPSPYRNSGSNSAGWSPISTVDSTVPATAPSALFNSERWDPYDSTEMSWHFPVPTGEQVAVRLYFANRCSCTSGAGQRVFNVAIDQQAVLTNFDIVAAAGDQVGTMRSFPVTSDGSVDIDFGHVTENPLVNGIEIVRTDIAPPPASAGDKVSTIHFDGTTAGATQPGVDGGIAWGGIRGAFMLGSNLYYGKAADGYLYKRTFDGTTYGPENKVDPYHDPVWDGVSNGSGGTYDGNPSAFYGEIGNVTGMFYSGGRLYYTQFGQPNLYYRYFTPDSDIVGADEFTASGGLDWSDTGGMFTSNGTLYFVKASTGALWSVPFSGGSPSGTPTDVNDPANGGQNWNARGLYVGPDVPANTPPVASDSISCPNLTCSFDGSAAKDPDGSVASITWAFGDGNTATATAAPWTVQHTYAQPGSYTVVQTVTDNRGGTSSTSDVIRVSDPATSPIGFVGTVGVASTTKTPTVILPSGVQAGNVILLTANVSSSTVTASAPSGWTLLGTADASGLKSWVWWKVASAADAGASVTTPLDSGVKATLQAVVYSGTNATTPVESFATHADLTTMASHVTPKLTASSGDWVVSLWADKASSGQDTWTAPAGVSTRVATYGTGTGSNFVDSLVADGGAAVGYGAQGGLTATTSPAGVRGATWTITLQP